MKRRVWVGFFFCIFLCVSGQITRDRPRLRIPTLSEILNNADTGRSSAVDLSAHSDSFGGVSLGFGGLQSDFAQDALGSHGLPSGEPTGHEHTHGHDVQHGNTQRHDPASVTDIQGNTPPPPTGVHVDLPGEHGNTNDFAVVHHGEAPISAPSEAGDPFENSNVNNVQRVSGSLHEGGNSLPIPSESSHSPNTVSVGPENSDHSLNPFHASNVHHSLPETRSNSRGFDDLAAIGSVGLGFRGSGLRPAFDIGSLLDNSADVPVIKHEHASAHMTHAVLSDHVNLSVPRTDEFVSATDGFQPAPSAVHSDISKMITQNDPLGGRSAHADLPGQHDKPINGVPIIHRESRVLENTSSGDPVIHTNVNDIGEHQSPSVGEVHVDMPGEHGNPADSHPVIHRESHHTDLSGIHIDAPGVHGNMLNEPALHLPPGASIHDAIAAGVIPDPFGPENTVDRATVGHQLETSADNVHVDMPGEHGNPPDGHPVVHRQGSRGTPVETPVNNVHIDMPGEHGNPVDGHPVVHREGQHNAEHMAGIPAGSGIVGTQLGNVHVDMPGEHGNPRDGHPVVHREGHQETPASSVLSSGFNNIASFPSDASGEIVGQRQHVNLSGIHIDPPGVHGNMLNEPALHLPPGATIQDAVAAGVIPDPFGPEEPIKKREVVDRPKISAQNIHVDMPGEHGNPIDGHPVIHREGPRNAVPEIGMPGSSLVTRTGNVHVDLPGQHGNPTDGHPVVHREGVVTNDIISGFGSDTGNVHVDMPGEHGNPINGHPVVHKEGTGMHDLDHHIISVSGPHTDTHLGTVHVDMPGMHGNPQDAHPVVHREGLHGAGGLPPQTVPHPGIPIGNVHVDMPGEHGNPIDGHPVIHREVIPHGSFTDTHSVHVDMPGVHGNAVDDLPTVHKDVPIFGPVVQTGVIPGTANVPIAPKFNVNGGKSLGDMLGIPTVRLSEAPILNDLERTNLGIVDENSVLLSNNRRRQRNRNRGGRRGRGRGRGGRRRRTTTTSTTTTTTTTTPAPSNPGSGITIIRSQRPNPLASLGNALRSALTGNNSGGGGLLGSLLRSAAGAQLGPMRIQPVGGGLFGGLFRGRR